MVGGLIRLYIDNKKNISEEERKEVTENGILYTSGLIAGEGLIGILLAVFAIINVNGKSLADWVNISGSINLGNIGGLVFFAVLIATIPYFMFKKSKKSK